jgi:hypothetical protein
MPVDAQDGQSQDMVKVGVGRVERAVSAYTDSQSFKSQVGYVLGVLQGH